MKIGNLNKKMTRKLLDHMEPCSNAFIENPNEELIKVLKEVKKKKPKQMKKFMNAAHRSSNSKYSE